MKAHFEFYTPEHEYLGVIKCKGKSAQFAQLVASGYTYHQNEMKYWPFGQSLDMYQDRNQLKTAAPKNYGDTSEFDKIRALREAK